MNEDAHLEELYESRQTGDVDVYDIDEFIALALDEED